VLTKDEGLPVCNPDFGCTPVSLKDANPFFIFPICRPLEFKKNNLFHFPVHHPTVWYPESEGLFHLRFVCHGRVDPR
jgi:hypothetical protein